MNIPISWLKDYVDIDVDVKKFAEDMTMSGTKVESVTHIGKEIKNVVIGKVLSVEKHPDADKLVVTSVDVGEKTVQIVTGATNVTVGCVVPVALDGAVLYEGLKIKNSKLRGVESQGMLCSIEELGYTRADYPEASEDGIYIFSEEHKPGSCAIEILQIKEDVVEFEITSNRPDCYSVVGIAREVAATYDKPLKYPEISVLENSESSIKDFVDVEVENDDLCPRYIARVVKNVKIGPSPQWLRHRLTTSGIKPINNIVDITNYVMLEFGQPVHAFDYSAIEDKKIIVRNAYESEKITTLDGIERQLDTSMLVIADQKKALAIAGVMGGEYSKVTDDTKTILFESANFNGVNIRLTSKKLGLRTDASSKYEKGLDPNISIKSVNRCIQLVEMLGIGKVVKDIVDCYKNQIKPWQVSYSYDKINKLLGTDISKEEMVKILKRLEIESDGSVANIKTFRTDIQKEADLAEEIARLYGYNNIKSTLAKGATTVGKKTYSQVIEDEIKNTMVSLGFSESLHFSFESPKVFDKLNYDKECNFRKTVTINNPLGEDFSVMRTTTLNGILNSLSTNYNRRNDEACLFELGKVYLPKDNSLPVEKQKLTIGMYSINTKSDKDFYYLKGAVNSLLDRLSIQACYTETDKYPWMHPGRTALITNGDITLGYVGELHPLISENYEISTKVYMAVLDVERIRKLSDTTCMFTALPKFPATSRDISMLVKNEITVFELEETIKEKGAKILESVSLFDVYKGKQIEEGYKSVSFKILFRANDRTLTDEEVSQVMEKVLKNLEKKHNALLRG